ncbi:hypothetical protein [Fusibacillus kribbianus]|nr:hypothetical protein [Ruminococcus sp. YH-rum2234]
METVLLLLTYLMLLYIGVRNLGEGFALRHLQGKTAESLKEKMKKDKLEEWPRFCRLWGIGDLILGVLAVAVAVAGVFHTLGFFSLSFAGDITKWVAGVALLFVVVGVAYTMVLNKKYTGSFWR